MTTATQTRAVHGVITMERTYEAAPARVFAAWSDVRARERWGRPSDDTVIVYDKAEFRVGGEDVSRCGAAGDLRFLARVRYLEIIAARRIVMAESVAEAGVSRAASLITVEFEPAGKATKLKLTLQVCALEGPGMLEGYRVGWTAALANLAAEF